MNLLFVFLHQSLSCGSCLYSFLVALADISLRKTGVEEKRSEVLKESKILLDFTRKAIARLTYLKRYEYVLLNLASTFL